MYKILLVDDEELVLMSLSHVVEWEKYGFCVAGTAASGKEAYEKIRQLQPDLVMTDICMQGVGGLELIQLVKREKPEIRFIILSGYAEFAYAKKALELGAAGYCLKPFDEVEIISYLKKIKSELDQDKKLVRKAALEEAKEKTEQADKAKKQRASGQNPTYVALAAYVNEHYMEDISPQSLAELFHINVSYLSQLFKKESGITYTEYLTNLRIKHACRLLGTTDAKIADIAEKVGFRDYFYFTRVFKKVMDMSPSEYRGE